MDLAFVHVAPTRLVFGNGCHRDAGVEVAELGCRRAFVVTDALLRGQTDIVARLEKALGDAWAGTFDGVVADSDVEVVEEGARAAKAAGADCLVSVGGGSSIDTAKAMAIVLTEGGGLRDHQGVQNLTRALTPHVVVPTTAGTGSEVSMAAVVKDRATESKLIFADHHLIPQVALLDPTLTVGLPARLTAATGMDALTHAVEALHSMQAQPIADALALHALRLLRRALPVAVKTPGDLEARGQLLVAANMAGQAFSNAQVGLVHAMAHTVGARFRVHHGLANSICLPHVIRFNAEYAEAPYTEAARALGVADAGPEGLARAVAELAAALGLPARLRDVAVPEEALAELAEATLGDASIVYNPRIVGDPAEIVPVWRAAW